MCQYVANVEQTRAGICEIHLILLRISREFNTVNSDFQFFQKQQELVIINSQTQQKVPFS